MADAWDATVWALMGVRARPGSIDRDGLLRLCGQVITADLPYRNDDSSRAQATVPTPDGLPLCLEALPPLVEAPLGAPGDTRGS